MPLVPMATGYNSNLIPAPAGYPFGGFIPKWAERGYGPTQIAPPLADDTERASAQLAAAIQALRRRVIEGIPNVAAPNVVRPRSTDWLDQAQGRVPLQDAQFLADAGAMPRTIQEAMAPNAARKAALVAERDAGAAWSQPDPESEAYRAKWRQLYGVPPGGPQSDDELLAARTGEAGPMGPMGVVDVPTREGPRGAFWAGGNAPAEFPGNRMWGLTATKGTRSPTTPGAISRPGVHGMGVNIPPQSFAPPVPIPGGLVGLTPEEQQDKIRTLLEKYGGGIGQPAGTPGPMAADPGALTPMVADPNNIERTTRTPEKMRTLPRWDDALGRFVPAELPSDDPVAVQAHQGIFGGKKREEALQIAGAAGRAGIPGRARSGVPMSSDVEGAEPFRRKLLIAARKGKAPGITADAEAELLGIPSVTVDYARRLADQRRKSRELIEERARHKRMMRSPGMYQMRLMDQAMKADGPNIPGLQRIPPGAPKELVAAITQFNMGLVDRDAKIKAAEIEAGRREQGGEHEQRKLWASARADAMANGPNMVPQWGNWTLNQRNRWADDQANRTVPGGMPAAPEPMTPPSGGPGAQPTATGDLVENAPGKQQGGNLYDFVNLMPEGTPPEVIKAKLREKGWSDQDIKVALEEPDTTLGSVFGSARMSRQIKAVERLRGKEIGLGSKITAHLLQGLPLVGPMASGIAGEIIPGSFWGD